ncbi:MAG: NifU family protein [bacterium]
MKNKILKILNSKIKPMLQADGGDLELIEVDEKNGIVKVRMTGMCSHCPMAEMTFRHGIEEVLKKEIKEIKKVELAK